MSLYKFTFSITVSMPSFDSFNILSLRKHLIVACNTNVFEDGLLNRATPNNEQQFHPSVLFPTKIINCFCSPSEPITSKLLKFLILSFFVIVESTTLTKIFLC